MNALDHLNISWQDFVPTLDWVNLLSNPFPIMPPDFFDKEISLIKKISGVFPRHPMQKNLLLESDAEVIDLSKKPFKYLVLKTDGIHEEIREKLYEDPYLIGWMAATVSISDLAACGAVPFGLLLTLQIPKEKNDDWLKGFQSGMQEACEQYEVYVLGGDTNFDAAISVSTTAVGTIHNGEPLSRIGLQPGDLLYATSLLGVGNAFAYAHYFDPQLNIYFKPLARLKESILIREYATSCIDTSDGLFPALSVLCELNNVGFEFDADLHSFLQIDAEAISSSARIPAWMLLAGPHGEYELLFTIPTERKIEFEAKFCEQFGQMVQLGKVTPTRKLQFKSDSMEVVCEPASIPNLFHEANGDVPLYFEMLKQQQQKWQAC